MKKIGIISDTHSSFDSKVATFLKDCDIVLHAGDIGNIDDHVVRSVHPEFVTVTVEGVKILMTHIGGYPRHYNHKAETRIVAEKPKIFISGHSPY